MRLGVAMRLCALIGLASCGDGPFEVQLSIELGATIDSATQATIKTYLLHTSGDETFDDSIALDPYPQRREGITYHPLATSKTIDISITAENAAGVVVATGAVSVSLSAGKRTSATITLTTNGLDLGTDAMGVVPLYVFNFESDAEDKSSLLTPQGSNCEIENSIVHSGMHAAHCHGNVASYYELDAPFFDASQPVLAVRAYVQTEQTTSPPGANVVMVGFDDTNTGDYAVIGIDDDNDWTFGYTDTNPDLSTGFPSLEATNTMAFSNSDWHCVEAVLTRPSTATFYYDNVEVGTAPTNVKYPDSFSFFELGITHIRNLEDGGVSVVGIYLDDVVIATQRIGCD